MTVFLGIETFSTFGCNSTVATPQDLLSQVASPVSKRLLCEHNSNNGTALLSVFIYVVNVV